MVFKVFMSLSQADLERFPQLCLMRRTGGETDHQGRNNLEISAQALFFSCWLGWLYPQIALFYQIAVWCTNHCFCSRVQRLLGMTEKEKRGSTSLPKWQLVWEWFPLCLLHLPPVPPSCPSTSAFPPVSVSLSRSVRGRRVWMWIELQIRSVLIMPLKRGLWEHLSLALSRNGRFPGSWSPPRLTSRHRHSYQHLRTSQSSNQNLGVSSFISASLARCL